jgi:hypothetical protein
MKRKKPPYVQEFIDEDGKPRFYLRKPGVKRVPLPGLPWSPEFMAAYEAGLGTSTLPEIGASRTKPGTVNAAIVSYYGVSADFKAMKSSTRKMRRAILERFRNEYGGQEYRDTGRESVEGHLSQAFPAGGIELAEDDPQPATPCHRR